MGVQFPPRAPNFAEASSRQATSIVNSKINFNSTLKGSIKIHRDGFGFFIPEDPEEKDLFIAPSHLNKALPNDVVLVRKIPGKFDHKPEGHVVKVIERGRKHWIGRIEKKGKSLVAHIVGKGFDFFIPLKKESKGLLNQNIIIDLDGHVIQVLKDSSSIEVLKIFTAHDIPEKFPDEVLLDAKNLENISLHSDYRRDLRKLPILTIDGIKARDFDDAVYVQKKADGYVLFVSIADVAHYVKQGSSLDNEARSRGTSVYFPQLCVPMLPEIISNHWCSLKAGEDRLTLTAEIHFSSQGIAEKAFFYESIIRSVKRGIYEEIQAFFDGDANVLEGEGGSPKGDSPGGGLKENLLMMRELAQLLIKQRKIRGVLDFDLPEPQVNFGPQGEISSITRGVRLFSHQLIEEFMIAANVAVAHALTKLGHPLLFRVHDKPDEEKMFQFWEFLKESGIKIPKTSLFSPKELAQNLEPYRSHPMAPIFHQMLLRSLKQASYQPEPIGHFGLNLPYYCHFTSPIRRYPDLVVHRALKDIFQNKTLEVNLNHSLPKKVHFKDDEFFHKLKNLGKYLSKRERLAMEAEREMLDYTRCLFASQWIGESFDGIVRRMNRTGFFVELAPHFVEGFLPKSALRGNYLNMGDLIPVVVKDVSMIDRLIFLELKEKKAKHFKRVKYRRR